MTYNFTFQNIINDKWNDFVSKNVLVKKVVQILEI